MSGYTPGRHHRRSNRLKGYDYSQTGAYFITICTQGRACYFGEIVEGKMLPNAAGQIVEKCWKDIPAHFPHAELDEFVIMPNHVHGILSIIESVGAKKFSPLPQPQQPGTSKTIGSIIRGFKTGVTKWMRANTDIHDIWQRNFYEHIIRDESSLHRIRGYIVNNRARWADDPENPGNAGVKNVTVRKTQDPTNADTPTRGVPYGNVMSVGAKKFSPLPRWDGKHQ